MPILGINGIYNGQHKRPTAEGAMGRRQSAKASTSMFREFPKRRNDIVIGGRGSEVSKADVRDQRSEVSENDGAKNGA